MKEGIEAGWHIDTGYLYYHLILFAAPKVITEEALIAGLKLMDLKKNKKKSRIKGKKRLLRDSVDKHDLYERAVQCAESEINFVDETFKELRNRTATKMREDFCGTGQVSVEWIKRRRDNVAIGIDIDPEVIAWGEARYINKLKPGQNARVSLVEENVLNVDTVPQDLILANNFSYWCFKERRNLLRYFLNVHKSLVGDGVFFLDCFGGYEAYRILEEETEHEDFTYLWEQADFNPINNHLLCHIHFAFPDGSRLDRAFSYSWRIWTLAEIREILLEAGFSQSLVFWQGWDDEREEGSGEFTIVEKAEPDAGWIAYVAALK